MADRNAKRKTLGRSASTESTDYSITMGKSVRKNKKPRERWLLTRKTWRYMADAGRKLIPDGAQNRLEDIPRIEAYFQEVCKKEPRFLLWRKNSYPGALGFRKKTKNRFKGGSCRKAISADEVDTIRPQRPTDLALQSTSGGRFDLRKMKEEFLNKPLTPTDYSAASTSGVSKSPTKDFDEEQEERQLVSMLEQYLHLAEREPAKNRGDFNYQELVDKLQRHLALASKYASGPSSSSNINYTNFYTQPLQVHFQGDHVQKSLSETLHRYFSQSTNRDRVISDLLTDRKALEKLYFDLRRTKGFRGGSRGGSSYSPSSHTHTFGSKLRSTRDQYAEKRFESSHPPPLIEIENETFEVSLHNWGIQTLPIPEIVLTKCEEDYKKTQAEQEEEERENRPHRRRSSVDNDDVSQSVSDTIKRYLRMARKKSVDTDKADRFKRVNYDRNLRNIKAKGEITKPGDDDGLNKGCQTNDDWVLTYRDLKFDEVLDVSDVESRVSSSRSSIDIGAEDGTKTSSPTSPPPTTKSSSHSFLSQLLHGKLDKHDKSSSSAAVAATAGAMQKSKSSSSVMHHGSRLMAKKIFRSRSKSQTRPPQTPCNWNPQGSCVWNNNVSGRRVVLTDTNLLHLSDIERKVLQKVAIAKLQALNLGVPVRAPTETVGAAVTKPKRRPYLLKRKALTTGIFDTGRGKDSDKDKDGSSAGLVFGIPLTQCVENDRVSRSQSSTSPFRSRGELTGSSDDPASTIGRHGSRASFSSLIEAHRGDEIGSCESLMSRDRIAGSVPGLLDALSCGSTDDNAISSPLDEETSIPNILNECIRHLQKYGLHTLGIFRVSTSKKRIRQLREDFDCGKETSLDENHCPHDVATLLKEYLRDLPDPLLCRDLYQAFVQTQRIRNRRLQFEALQHLIQLLPPANRDTLFALLHFLSIVARHSNDSRNESGESTVGNKMDTNNLATVFAPNILHCIKPGAKEIAADKPEDRIDIINVVRTLIDHYRQLYCVSCDLLDEVYVHMMDSHPEVLDQLMNKRDAVADDRSLEDVDSETNSAPWTPTQPTSDVSIENLEPEGRGTPSERRRTYSREECLHEAAATGGPNVGMRIRYKDRIRERSSRRKRDDSLSRKRKEDEMSSPTSSGITLISRLKGQKDEEFQYVKNRSSSVESSSSVQTDSDVARVLRISEDLQERRKSSPFVLDNNGVITASLTIPVQQAPYNIEDDIPYIEDVDSGRQQFTIGIVKAPTAPPRRRLQSTGSDSSNASIAQPITGSISLIQGYDSAMGSSATYSSPVQNTPSSVSSSIADAGIFSSPPSWASTPPTSPESTQTSVNYIPDDLIFKSRPTKSITSLSTKEAPVLQKVSFSSVQEVQQVKQTKDSSRTYHREVSYQKQAELNRSLSAFESTKAVERESTFSPSITSIGNAVLRSKTADFERIMKVENKQKATTTSTSVSSSSLTSTTPSAADREKKKYTKRRYTDSRHQTRHIPDSDTLETSITPKIKDEKTLASTSAASQTPVYKRRELISSVPSK